MTVNRPVSILILTLLLTSSSLSQNETNEINSTTLPSPAALAYQDARDSIARSVNEFGFKLTVNMMKKDLDKNIVISPTGIAGLLAMTLLGSVGATYEELAKTLGFSQDIIENRKNHEQFGQLLNELNDNPPVIKKEVDISNDTSISNSSSNETDTDLNTRTLYADAILVDAKTQIRNIYRQYLSNVYHGDVINANVSDTTKTLQQINDWVKNHTEGKIEDFLKAPLPDITKTVLLSALYFSGQWARPFLEEYTRSMPFHKPSGDVVAELMLNLGEFNYTYKVQHGVQIIAVPYNHSDTTMYILKPLNQKKSLLETLESLDYRTIENYIKTMTEQECVLRFPKMDLKTKVDLKDSLQELGLKSVFTPGQANFALMVDVSSKIEDDDILTRIYEGKANEPKKLEDVVNSLPNPGIHVESVLHDVKISINEYGTIATAATSGILTRTARLFYADSPFYMFIRNERTKLVTFSAAIFDPTEAS